MENSINKKNVIPVKACLRLLTDWGRESSICFLVRFMFPNQAIEIVRDINDWRERDFIQEDSAFK